MRRDELKNTIKIGGKTYISKTANIGFMQSFGFAALWTFGFGALIAGVIIIL